MFELEADLIGDALKLTTHLGGALVKVLCQRVQVLHVPHLLLLLLNLKGTNVLLKLSLLYPVIVLGVLEGDFRVLVEVR